jgi:hypothetical protein
MKQTLPPAGGGSHATHHHWGRRLIHGGQGVGALGHDHPLAESGSRAQVVGAVDYASSAHGQHGLAKAPEWHPPCCAQCKPGGTHGMRGVPSSGDEQPPGMSWGSRHQSRRRPRQSIASTWTARPRWTRERTVPRLARAKSSGPPVMAPLAWP